MLLYPAPNLGEFSRVDSSRWMSTGGIYLELNAFHHQTGSLNEVWNKSETKFRLGQSYTGSFP